MPEEKKTILSQFTISNVIAVTVIIGGFASAYLTMKSHINDNTIHVTPNEKVLTTQEYNRLIQWADEFPTIQNNENRLIEIEKDFAVFENSFNTLYSEHEGLESKVSRNYVELLSKIEP